VHGKTEEATCGVAIGPNHPHWLGPSQMNNRERNCRLCNVQHNPIQFDSGELRPCDTILFKTANFVLLPSIGPLVRGHAMVVSRMHYSSLASMPQEAIREYEELA
jgi:hypothetical protein